MFVFLQVSALLGRIPSAVGYQPTLATDMGTMQERITTTKKGSITSVQVRRHKMRITFQHTLLFLVFSYQYCKLGYRPSMCRLMT